MVVESGLMWLWRRLPEPTEADLKRRYLAGARKASAAGLIPHHSSRPEFRSPGNARTFSPWAFTSRL